MRNLILALLMTLSIQVVLATDQTPDLLVIGKDTICLKSFPLEELNFEQRPFKYGNADFPNTGCWRGYQALWEVKNDTLFLVAIRKDDATREKVDLKTYFEKNGYEPIMVDGKVFANWYSATFEKYNSYGFFNPCIVERDEPKSKRNIKLSIVNGLLIFTKWGNR